ncbi:glycoside hydrolase family 36 protein [Coraliomargarita algicola]|uniref:Glycoside hydrolase family 36 protein n=1 Tax=Coraliomargarita algicola TaxID=3092156 RepID=A0ABZ0RQH7_9BACT|nr:glycoside hydrolase family 36 protein [Coraliomargarita sp. J2-16]WPJ95179.1 glycoside hydrolase family 36 protein [Coraliomargarita sp. J2-16]
MPNSTMQVSRPYIRPESIRSLDPTQKIDSSVSTTHIVEGLAEHTVTIHLKAKKSPGPVHIDWYVPLVDIAGKWHPTIGSDRSLTSGWTQTIQNYATYSAPVYSLFSAQSENRHTFALSDAINPTGIRVQVEEDDATINCRIVLFDSPWPEIDSYRITIRIDERALPFHKAVASTADWWAKMDAYTPAPVPAAAYDPVYSSWYSFHQELSDQAIEENCKWSKGYNCKTLILDDGWQTDDSNKGYDYCGDWEVATSKFPDFKSHVAQVKAMDMRYMVWFSVPFVGKKSKAWHRFSDRVLPKAFKPAPCLDPRFAEARQMLINCYRDALIDWNIDGFKLDFVDRFTAEAEVQSTQETADMVAVPAAADRLFTDIITELRAIKPDVLIEFRQDYIGPAMRKYGNMLRAHDCPNDALSNLVRTIDLRLLAGNTAVHSDMVMWHPEESVERAAQQLWAILFSVPQISVRKGVTPAPHEGMLKNFMSLWVERKELLLHGELTPLQPQKLYPAVHAENAEEHLVAVYQDDYVVQLPELSTPKLTLINATQKPKLYLEQATQKNTYQGTVHNCLGETMGHISLKDPAGIRKIQIPASGYALLSH